MEVVAWFSFMSKLVQVRGRHNDALMRVCSNPLHSLPDGTCELSKFVLEMKAKMKEDW